MTLLSLRIRRNAFKSSNNPFVLTNVTSAKDGQMDTQYKWGQTQCHRV